MQQVVAHHAGQAAHLAGQTTCKPNKLKQLFSFVTVQLLTVVQQYWKSFNGNPVLELHCDSTDSVRFTTSNSGHCHTREHTTIDDR